MSVQSFDKNILSDLGYSLKKDVIKNNLVGASSSSTVVLCNTRSWHGLLSVYDSKTESMKVILSTLDDSIISGNKTFLLSTRKYPDVFFPLGHQYILSANFNPFTCIEYSIGNILLRKEMLLCTNEETLLLKYTLQESVQPVRLQIRPIVAFREASTLRRVSHDIITGNAPVVNGIGYHLYQNEPYLYMQTSKPSEFVTAPDWNYNIEYEQDHAEGKPYQEDLFMPGFFDIELDKGESVIFCASMKNQNPSTLEDFYKSESYTRMKRHSYEDFIQFAANQMFREYNGECIVVEKMPPSPYFSKDRFGALPGLTLPNGNFDMFLRIAKSYLKRYKNGAFGDVDDNNYAPESPFWFIWAVQQYSFQRGNFQEINSVFGPTVQEIVRLGITNNIPGLFTDINGLVCDSRGPGKRFYAEINAMWYNSILFAHYIACLNGDTDFANSTNTYARMLASAFNTRFVDKSVDYLADSVDEFGNKDLSCCPGQLVAMALPYPIVGGDMIAKALSVVEKKLLTPVGLRNLSPDDPKFGPDTSITPYYLGFLAELYLKNYGEDGIKKANEIYHLFDEKLNDVQSPNFYEKFSAEPPYEGKGSPLSAVTIASINRIKMLIDQF